MLHVMSYNSETDGEELRKRIRTLTSLLRKFKVQKSPSKQSKEILPFLSHFTTLLTRGDREAIAVTGSINGANQARTLIVAQNWHLGSNNLSLEVVKKRRRFLQEVVKGYHHAHSWTDHYSP